MNNIHGKFVGRVSVKADDGTKVMADVYEDRTVIMPDGSVRKVKQEYVDKLIAQNAARQTPAAQVPQQIPQQASQPSPAQQPAQPAQQMPGYQTPGGYQQQPQYQTPYPPVQQPASAYQPDYAAQTPTPAPIPEPVAKPAAKKDRKKRKREEPAPAPAAPSQPSLDMEEKPAGKKGVIIGIIIAALVAFCVLGYAFVPAFYDGVNGVLSSITGKTVGVPPTTSTSVSVDSPAQSEVEAIRNELKSVNLDGDVTITFYASVRTADGQEYKVPLSSASLANGTLTSLADASGFNLISNSNNAG